MGSVAVLRRSFLGYRWQLSPISRESELCDALRRLASADGIHLTLSFDEFNVYAKTAPAGQLHL